MERRFNKPPKPVTGKDGTSYTQHSLDEILNPQETPKTPDIEKPKNIIPFNQKPSTPENRDNTPHSTGWVTDKWG